VAQVNLVRHAAEAVIPHRRPKSSGGKIVAALPNPGDRAAAACHARPAGSRALPPRIHAPGSGLNPPPRPLSSAAARQLACRPRAATRRHDG